VIRSFGKGFEAVIIDMDAQYMDMKTNDECKVTNNAFEKYVYSIGLHMPCLVINVIKII
jgi:hypothetical protein